VPVEIVARERPLEVLQNIVGPLISPLGSAGLIIVVVIFMLLEREDLRDRFIRLVGYGDLHRTTEALRDAGKRVGRYLLMQMVVNIVYAIPIAIGLWILGIPNALLWGLLALALRFVPYIGPVIGALLPLFLALAVAPGWELVAWTAALFVVMELVTGNVVEPWLYGSRTGLSPLAIIVAAIFWTWLWGPLGLVLSTPLTVCLVVLGRHVEGLNFLEVLLGDAPALTPAQGFYQRALIGDPAEATNHAELSLKEGRPLVAYLDEVALAGLKLAERDAERGSLDEEKMERIDATVEEMMDNLADFEPRRWFRKVPTDKEESEEEEGGLASLANAEKDMEDDRLPVLEAADLAPGFEGEDAILCIGGRTPLDEAAAAMLAGVLQRHGLKARAVPSETISAAHIVSLEASKAKLVCLSYLGTGGSGAHIRYLVRRLRRILPEGAMVLVGYWTDEGEARAVKALEATAEADAYATSLREAAELCLNAARGHAPAEGEKAPARVA